MTISAQLKEDAINRICKSTSPAQKKRSILFELWMLEDPKNDPINFTDYYNSVLEKEIDALIKILFDLIDEKTIPPV